MDNLRSICHSSTDDPMTFSQTIATLADWSHSTRSLYARFVLQMLSCSGRVLRGLVRQMMVTVAMSAMMMKSDPTTKTMLKVTMSMMTTMTTGLHRDFQNDRSSSPLSTVQVACIQGVLWSTKCCCLLFGWVARPCTGLCSNAFPWEWLRNSSFPTLPCQTLSYRFACILARACAFDIARQRGGAPRSFQKLCLCAESR